MIDDSTLEMQTELVPTSCLKFWEPINCSKGVCDLMQDECRGSFTSRTLVATDLMW